MTHFFKFMLAAAILTTSAGLGHAQDAEVPKAKADAFDSRMFAGAPGDKAYACFVRSYDAAHLARHPKQKVAAMKLLMAAERAPEEKITSFSFSIGMSYRNRPGDFDSGGNCNHTLVADAGHEIRFTCGVDCEGGGIDVALSKDNKAAIVRLQSIAVWKDNKPDEDARQEFTAGTDDKIFRLDRVATDECASLLTDGKELAAVGHE